MATNTPTLFEDDELPDRFKTAQERYGVWPTTIWPIDHSDKKHRTLRDLIGDEGTVRAGSFTRQSDDKYCYRGKVLASVFSPALCSYILNCYAPATGLVIDPFAGGGTRAIMAAARGLDYQGTEIRQAEVDVVTSRLADMGYADNVTIHTGDARNLPDYLSGMSGDFLYTCPPYFDLETYKGGPSDLSELKTYSAFCAALEDVARACYTALKPGAKACWVVGLHRDKTGALLPLHHDTARAHINAGFRLLEEVIINHVGTGSIQRVGQFEKGSKRLVRVHEYLLVFEKIV